MAEREPPSADEAVAGRADAAGPTSGSAAALGAATGRELLLALQQSAGNRAVGRLLGPRRRIARAPVDPPQLGDPPLASDRVEIALRAWTGGLGWWRADEFAGALTEDDLRSLSFDQRLLILAGIAGESRIDGRDEKVVVDLLFTTPREQSAALLGRLRAEDSQILRRLDAGIHGENYRLFHRALRDLALVVVPLTSTARELPWSSPGLLGTAMGNERVFYEQLEIGEGGRVLVQYSTADWGTLPVEYKRRPEWKFDLEPFELVRVRFGYDEPEINAVAGDVLIVPAVNLLMLGNRQYWSGMATAVDVGLVFGGGVNVAGATTRKGLALGIVDVGLGAGSLAVNEFRAKIAAIEGGREFLDTWDLVQYAIMGYAVGRALVEAPGMVLGLWRACRPRVALAEEKLLRIDAEVEGAVQQLEARGAGAAADDVAGEGLPPAPGPHPPAPELAAPPAPAPHPPAPEMPAPAPHPPAPEMPAPAPHPPAPEMPAPQMPAPPAPAPQMPAPPAPAPQTPALAPPSATSGELRAAAAVRRLKVPQWKRFERIQMTLEQHHLSWADAGIQNADQLADLLSRPDFDKAMAELNRAVNLAVRRRGLAAVEELKDPQLYPDVSDEPLTVRPTPRLPERSRLPRGTELAPGDVWSTAKGGFWGGPPGNSPWYSDMVEVNAVTKDRPIRFRNGYPDFEPYVKARAWLLKVTGDDPVDFAAANRALARQRGWVTKKGKPIAARAEAWMKENGLTWHHHQDRHTMLAVPTLLHENVPHIGGAAAR